MKRLEVEEHVKDCLDDAMAVADRALRMDAAVYGGGEPASMDASAVLTEALEDFTRARNTRIGVLTDELLNRQAGAS